MLSFSSPFLPVDARLDEQTGVFEWTPGYTQAGHYEIPIYVSDGTSSSEITLIIDVANANGAPVLNGFDSWEIAEGQTLVFRTEGFDPDNPYFVLPERDTEGNLLFYEGSERVSLHYELTGLPEGASYDTETGTFVWETGYQSAGTYTLQLTATDDGDGTGTNAVKTIDISIVIEDFNRQPELGDLPNITVQALDTQSIPLNSIDPDGGDLTIFATATRAASADQIVLDPTPIPLDGSSSFGRIVYGPDGPAIELTPGLLDRGNWLIEILVEDHGNGIGSAPQSDTGAFVLTVGAPNFGPTLSPVAGLAAVVGEELVYTLKATDPDRDVLTFSGENLPAGVTIEPGATYGEAILRFTPTAAQLGTTAISILVSDVGGGEDRIDFDLVVRETNATPVLSPIGTLQVAEGETLDHTFQAGDANGDLLTYSATNLPTGALLDPLTGRLTFTPHMFQAGQYDDIVVSISDGMASASETISIIVANTNRPPVFIEPSTQLGREQREITFRLLASDPDNDAVRFQVRSQLPAGARLDEATGTFRWTPGYNQAGFYQFQIAAIDVSGAEALRTINVEIADENRAPTPIVANRALVLGETLEIALQASDPDTGTTPVVGIESLPDGASFDPGTGLLIFTPGPAQIGDHVIRVYADDGKDRTVKAMVIRVTADPVPPVATIDLTPSFPAVPGQKVIISTAAAGFVPVVEKRLFVNGVEVVLDDLGRATFTAGTPGKVSVLLLVTDADGRVGEMRKTIAIRDPGDVASPVLDLSVTDGAVLEAGAITGSVADLTLDKWSLTLIHGVSGHSTVLASGTSDITGALADFDPSKMISGFYTLRLEAHDVSGYSSLLERSIEVLPVAAAGIQLTVTDATIDLGGVSI